MGNKQDLKQFHQNEGPIPLDVLMKRLGLWSNGDVTQMDNAERIKKIKNLDKTVPVRLSQSFQDPDGLQTAVFKVAGLFQEEEDYFDCHLTYWSHKDENATDTPNSQDQHILVSRFILVPENEWVDGIPSYKPAQIYLNGQAVYDQEKQDFDDNYDRKHAARLLEVYKQVSEAIYNKKTIYDITKFFHGDHVKGHFIKAATGEEPFLDGLDQKGWSAVDRSIAQYYASMMSGTPQNPAFHLPEIPGYSDDERLLAVHGYDFNTVDQSRDFTNGNSEFAASFVSGKSYVIQSKCEFDDHSNKAVMRISIMPQDNPDGDEFEPYDLIRMEYNKEKAGSFMLDNVHFMGSADTGFKSLRKSKQILGAMIKINQHIANKTFPPIKDILFEHGLMNDINELPPIPEASNGHETLWLSLFGCETSDTKFDEFGLGVGSCQAFLSRHQEEDGSVNESAVIFDVPLETTTGESDFDAAQPNILKFKKQLDNGGYLVITHGHYDHNSLAEMASQVDNNGKGWLRGVPVILSEYDYYTIRDKMTSLKVPRYQWPEFIRYDTPEAQAMHPDLHKVDDNNYIWTHTDNEGRVRGFNQICKGGSIHTAISDIHCYTPAKETGNPDHPYEFGHSTMLLGDTAGVYNHGQDFLRQGQLALADHIEGVEREHLLEVVPDEDSLYTLLMEATSINKSGFSIKKDEFQESIRMMLRSLPEGKIPAFTGFSTNHLEYWSILEVLNEPEFIRHTVGVGASAEHRLTAMNTHVVDPFLDLSSVKIPHDKLPQEAYDVALEAIESYCQKRYDAAVKKAAKPNSKKTAQDILKDDVTYNVFKFFLEESRKEISGGETKPVTIFQAFFDGRSINQNGQELTIMEHYARQLGFAPTKSGNPQRSMPTDVKRALQAKRKEIRNNPADTLKVSEEFEMAKDLVDSSTTYWMLKSLESKGKIVFDPTRDLIGQQNMYIAIMNDQKECSVRRTRTSKAAGRQRKNQDKLALFLTGPIGSAQEHFATLPKLYDGRSLLDANAISRSTGFKIDAKDIIPINLQPGSMGEDAEITRDAMIENGSRRRGMISYAASGSGFKVYNAGEHESVIRQALHMSGSTISPKSPPGQIAIHSQGAHIEGHMRIEDARHMLSADYMKASNVELVHISGRKAKNEAQRLIQECGLSTTIEHPQDWTARKAIINEGGKVEMQTRAQITPSMFGIKKSSPFGKPFGWVIDFFRLEIFGDYGHNKSSPLDIRSESRGVYKQSTAQSPFGGFAKPSQGQKHRGSRARTVSPSPSDIQSPGGKPIAPLETSLLAHIVAINASTNEQIGEPS